MTSIEELLREHAFFRDFSDAQRALIAGCGRNEAFADGEYLAREGAPADRFHLVRKGRVALEIVLPTAGARVIQTVGEGEIMGFSWLIPPHRWTFGARAVGVVRTCSFDGTCLRTKCEADHELGYRLMTRFSQVIVARLQATRMQLLDVYASGNTP